MATPATVRTIRIPADVGRLAEVREMVRSASVAAGADQGFVDDLVQAVDESATNAIVHGHGGRFGWVEVGVAREGERLVVTIEDDAPAFDPTTVPAPDLSVPPEHRQPGGMGVHLTLGAFGTLGLLEAELELGAGDVVLFYTDGVTDARAASGERFEEDRLLAAIDAARGEPGTRTATGIVEAIRAAVGVFQAGMAPADDVTIVAIGRRPKVRGRRPRGVSACAGSRDRSLRFPDPASAR